MSADPRKGATVQDQDLNNEFVKGFTEGRSATSKQVYRLALFFGDTQLHEKDFADLDGALRAAAKHLEHGRDCWVRIVVVDAADADDKDAPEQLALPFEEDDVSS